MRRGERGCGWDEGEREGVGGMRRGERVCGWDEEGREGVWVE